MVSYGLLESVRHKESGKWALRFYGGRTRYALDDAGNVLLFDTKVAAEHERRHRERGQGYAIDKSDRFVYPRRQPRGR